MLASPGAVLRIRDGFIPVRGGFDPGLVEATLSVPSPLAHPTRPPLETYKKLAYLRLLWPSSRVQGPCKIVAAFVECVPRLLLVWVETVSIKFADWVKGTDHHIAGLNTALFPLSISIQQDMAPLVAFRNKIGCGL